MDFNQVIDWNRGLIIAVNLADPQARLDLLATHIRPTVNMAFPRKPTNFCASRWDGQIFSGESLTSNKGRLPDETVGPLTRCANTTTS
jgi:hypothetical protein